ncbi:MAG: tRNA pseudouridine(38-40) synthase TruA [Actinomycetota bacterium]|nr:tRNA pseudouridine(38-40) synthase TruA [Actinomycetota bacterium]
MRNIKLVMEYKGTNYHGFQRQPNLPTIQGELEKTLSQILQENIVVKSAGRTDAGVHALHQVINFRTRSQIPLLRLQHSLNSLLPRDIAVKEAEEVDESFDARRNATSREYKYFIMNKDHPSPFFAEFSHFIASSLDIDAMQEAAKLFLGTHDFTAFCVQSDIPKNPVRTIFEISCKKVHHDLLCIKIKADSFLHKMVRTIVGTLIRVGLGNLTLEQVAEIMEKKDRDRAGPTVPAKGLFLSNICYD